MASSGDHVAGQRAGLGGGELERVDRPLGLDPRRLDRLGRLAAMISANSSRRSASSRAAVSRTSARFQRGSGPPASAALADADGTVDVGRRCRPGPARSRAVVRRRDGCRLGPGEALTGERERPHRDWLHSCVDHTAGRGQDLARPRHPFLDWPGPIAFAHRGGASEAPENTMPAFERAVELGYRYLETDVHVTADGVVVAFHDDDLARTCGRPGRISELPWREVATARVDGTRADPPARRAARRVARRPHQHRLQDRPASSTRSATCSTRAGVLDRVCVGAFSDRRLARLRRRFGRRCARAPGRSSSACCGCSGSPRAACWRPRCRSGAAGSRSSTTAFVARAHRRGVEVHVWTIDDAGRDGPPARPRRRRHHDRPPGGAARRAQPSEVSG